MTHTELFPHSTHQPRSLTDVADMALDLMREAKARNTIRSYRADWCAFESWCIEHDRSSLPASPDTLVLYLTDAVRAGLKVSTLQRRQSAISQAHQAAGLETPTAAYMVRTLMAGIRRERGTAPGYKTAAVTEILRAMVAGLTDKPIGCRDRALLLLGFSGAFRRSELVSLDIPDLEFAKDGFTVTLRRSKTDQEQAGRRIGIPYGSNLLTCPVRAMEVWLSQVGMSGPLFRAVNRGGRISDLRLCDKAVALIIKRRAVAAGLNPANYAGHSLRSGLATSAAAAGVSERAIMAQTGHTSLTIVRRYIREGSLFRENAAAAVGL